MVEEGVGTGMKSGVGVSPCVCWRRREEGGGGATRPKFLRKKTGTLALWESSRASECRPMARM